MLLSRGPSLVSIVGLFLLAASCAATDDRGGVAPPTTSTTRAEPSSAPTAPTSDGSDSPSTTDGPSALDDRFSAGFPDPIVDPAEIVSGGPPPDGIPPIDEPVFLDVVGNGDILPANEPVVAVEINGDARAYPVRALVWHEIVNDVVGGVPVAVTYCPLCNSAATYERIIDGVETTFGTSGMLYASALVMYDRATETLWTHYNGEAIVGRLAGTRLVEHPSPLLAWADFHRAYPDGQVLDWSRTGFDRRYGTNPYTGYDDEEATPFLFRGALDDRSSAMQRVVGIEVGGEAVALTLDMVDGDGSGPTATPLNVGGIDLVIFWVPGQSSALDTSEISAGRAVGSVAVFEATVTGIPSGFFVRGSGFVDTVTGTDWTIAGRKARGASADTDLTRVPHLDTFWFAWSTYQPGTILIGG